MKIFFNVTHLIMFWPGKLFTFCFKLSQCDLAGILSIPMNPVTSGLDPVQEVDLYPMGLGVIIH